MQRVSISHYRRSTEEMQKRRLQVKISFEPNRLAERFLADAYEKVASTVKQSKNIGKKNKPILESEISLEKTGVL